MRLLRHKHTILQLIGGMALVLFGLLWAGHAHAQIGTPACASLDPSVNLIDAALRPDSIETQVAVQEVICNPQTRIRIPGLSFSSASTVVDNAIRYDSGDVRYLQIPFLGEYLAAVYQYAIFATVVVSVIFIIISGIQWITSRGETDKLQQAKKRIVQTVSGLLIAVSSYVILYTINPDLVNFKQLRIEYIAPLEKYDDGPEFDCPSHSGPHPMQPDANGFPTNLDDKNQCIYDNFFPGKRIGEEPDIVRIQDAFGIPGLRASVNAHSAPAWQAAMDEVAASSDPEVQGFVRWMAEFRLGNVPDLSGNKDGAGVISANPGRIGYNKRDCPLPRFTYSMHSTGLALDIMTRSNWDVHIASYNTSKGTLASSHCSRLKRKYDDNESGIKTDLIEESLFELDRIPGKLDECIAEQLPWSSIPDEFVRIFESHGFYWGGHGWTRTPGQRSDSMHFEYLGPCAGL